MSVSHVLLGLLLLFGCLVGAGVTGSSVQLHLEQPGFIESDAKVLLGENRPIRTDEWLVVTRMAIGQRNHQPAFPIVNTNVGSDGQNMLIISMTGVPVAHLSALAKPATWGFFAFDLRRALAWYWWLPPFGCLIALWGVMAVLLPGRWRLGLATAAVFTSSAYVVAWSNWPAYAVLFPAAAFYLFFQLLRASCGWRLLVLAAGLGLSLAGFVLVLYPPWQITLGYLFGLLTIAVLLRDRLWTLLRSPSRVAALAASAIVFAWVCWSWWSDARLAIDAMQATIYPGQRTTIAGGGMYLFMSFRGFLNAHTLYSSDGAFNPSESSSFFYFFPVAAAAMVLAAVKRCRPSAIDIALLLFCTLAVWFQLVGFGTRLAELSLWGRVPPARVDLSLGLASVLWCSLRLGSVRLSTALDPRVSIAVSVALAWAAVVTLLTMRSPEIAFGPLPGWLWIALPVGVFALSWALLARKPKAFLGGLLALNVLATFPFNPLARAPTFVRATPRLLEQAGVDRQPTLVVGSLTAASALLAAGLPITNGVFYYPPVSLWNALDPEHASKTAWNRFQHLVFEPMAADAAATYRIVQRGDDPVRVAFDPDRFDFGIVKAGLVLTPTDLDLSRNPHLKPLLRQAGHALYQVCSQSCGPVP